jgi:hypothetical protein
MPLLVTVPPSLVAFAFYKIEQKAIGNPLNVQHVSTNNIFGSRHEIPLENPKYTWKCKLIPFLLQKKLTNLSVDVESHLLLPDNSHVPLNYLLVGNMTPDALTVPIASV